MVLNTTFNNISVISWWSVLLVEETGGPEKTTDLLQVTDKLYHIILYTSPWSRFELTTSAVIGTDCIGSCKFNYHTIMATTAPPLAVSERSLFTAKWENIFSHIMARSYYILMRRWWWCPLCNIPIRLDGFFGSVMVMVFNTTFNNIPVISWQAVLLVEETRVPWENDRPDTSNWQTSPHNVVSSRTHNVSGDRH